MNWKGYRGSSMLEKKPPKHIGKGPVSIRIEGRASVP